MHACAHARTHARICATVNVSFSYRPSLSLRLAFTLRDVGFDISVLYTDIAYCLGEKMGEEVEFMKAQRITFIPLPG